MAHVVVLSIVGTEAYVLIIIKGTNHRSRRMNEFVEYFRLI